ncbi:gamma-glutamyl-gamma-aminobutyrate hydrolase family protein [Salinarimonas rosea]|uniref:gamma-glutamyl-gamma-aminobutyrate hydrolase family protein n=1 Tax=Salinarimonas rosea TaxID=552063 RepID=UPI00048ADC8E|nr:gamma-glutamyl-gamma-aminobutyrate hydrolase family protein [Salinarimonas rosea]
MTRVVAITMLRHHLPERDEWRDALDAGWWGFLECCGLVPLCLPNRRSHAAALLDRALRTRGELAGLLLTGGGAVGCTPEARTERDDVEDLAIAAVSAEGLPIFGVCRGLQKICLDAGGCLVEASGHVATRHRVVGPDIARVVNSYHHNVIGEAPAGFVARARAADGGIEWMQDDRRRMAGIMWHPEREPDPFPSDVAIVQSHFSS